MDDTFVNEVMEILENNKHDVMINGEIFISQLTDMALKSSGRLYGEDGSEIGMDLYNVYRSIAASVVLWHNVNTRLDRLR